MTFLLFFGAVVGILVYLEWATRPNDNDNNRPPSWHKRPRE